jgi:hypothetical protein
MVLKKMIKMLVLIVASVFSLTIQAQEVYTIKFATLIPADTAWMKEVDVPGRRYGR